MKKKLTLIILVVIATLSLVGCGEIEEPQVDYTTQPEDWIYGNSANWIIVQSPITGRYYEIVRHMYNAPMSLVVTNGMSEVTEQEYLKYLEMVEK